jgi:hypothetical protein
VILVLKVTRFVPLIGGTRETRSSRVSKNLETRQTEKPSAVQGVRGVEFKVHSIDPLQLITYTDLA